MRVRVVASDQSEEFDEKFPNEYTPTTFYLYKTPYTYKYNREWTEFSYAMASGDVHVQKDSLNYDHTSQNEQAVSKHKFGGDLNVKAPFFLHNYVLQSDVESGSWFSSEDIIDVANQILLRADEFHYNKMGRSAWFSAVPRVNNRYNISYQKNRAKLAETSIGFRDAALSFEATTTTTTAGKPQGFGSHSDLVKRLREYIRLRYFADRVMVGEKAFVNWIARKYPSLYKLMDSRYKLIVTEPPVSLDFCSLDPIKRQAKETVEVVTGADLDAKQAYVEGALEEASSPTIVTSVPAEVAKLEAVAPPAPPAPPAAPQ